ncbi:hypothetical protein C0Q70_14641 [Pomacea canaliculata]|uniref:Uncharacterized protein n=2 Tax=Pomacea canaliculata TaxID=400727 RepID=A0A2T7NSL6_POMCA|nr:hypothetical protein C0Q70_14641 [Pomacea canaliculata]
MSCAMCQGQCRGHLEVIGGCSDAEIAKEGRHWNLTQHEGRQHFERDLATTRQLSPEGSPDSVPRSPSLALAGGRKRKLVLHFDLRNTLLVADSITNVSVEQALNSFLTGATWGQEVEGRWEWYSDQPSLKPPAPGLLTYYKYLERHLVRTPSDRTALRLATGDFTLTPLGAPFRSHFLRHLQRLQWQHPQWGTGVDQQHPLTMSGSDGRRYHYILEAVYRLLHHLYDTNRQVALVIRTYGLDAANVLASLQHGLKGNHPGFPKPIPLPICRTPGVIQRPKSDAIILKAFRQDSPTDLQVYLTHERDIYRYLSNSQGVVGYMDDFRYWQAHNYNHHAGKPLWIDTSDLHHHHMFFDDNFRALDEDSIVDVRVFSQEETTHAYSLGKQQLSRLEDVCVVQADLLHSIDDKDYFLRKVELCEHNYSRMLKMNAFPM